MASTVNVIKSYWAGLVGRVMDMHAQAASSGLVIGRTLEVIQSGSLRHEGIPATRSPRPGRVWLV